MQKYVFLAISVFVLGYCQGRKECVHLECNCPKIPDTKVFDWPSVNVHLTFYCKYDVIRALGDRFCLYLRHWYLILKFVRLCVFCFVFCYRKVLSYMISPNNWMCSSTDNNKKKWTVLLQERRLISMVNIHKCIYINGHALIFDFEICPILCICFVFCFKTLLSHDSVNVVRDLILPKQIHKIGQISKSNINAVDRGKIDPPTHELRHNYNRTSNALFTDGHPCIDQYFEIWFYNVVK
jgi:hypothetical protein